jgi:hypothetical protein
VVGSLYRERSNGVKESIGAVLQHSQGLLKILDFIPSFQYVTGSEMEKALGSAPRRLGEHY